MQKFYTGTYMVGKDDGSQWVVLPESLLLKMRVKRLERDDEELLYRGSLMKVAISFGMRCISLSCV